MCPGCGHGPLQGGWSRVVVRWTGRGPITLRPIIPRARHHVRAMPKRGGSVAVASEAPIWTGHAHAADQRIITGAS